MIKKFIALLLAWSFTFTSFSAGVAVAVTGDDVNLAALNAHGLQATGVSKRCVSYSRIRRTEVLDDKTILFHMTGGAVYANILKHNCYRLGIERAIKYEVRGGTLCNIDHVEVLTGSSIPGPTCGLGSFYKVEEYDDVEAEATSAVE